MKPNVFGLAAIALVSMLVGAFSFNLLQNNSPTTKPASAEARIELHDVVLLALRPLPGLQRVGKVQGLLGQTERSDRGVQRAHRPPAVRGARVPVRPTEASRLEAVPPGSRGRLPEAGSTRRVGPAWKGTTSKGHPSCPSMGPTGPHVKSPSP